MVDGPKTRNAKVGGRRGNQGKSGEHLKGFLGGSAEIPVVAKSKMKEGLSVSNVRAHSDEVWRTAQTPGRIQKVKP